MARWLAPFLALCLFSFSWSAAAQEADVDQGASAAQVENRNDHLEIRVGSSVYAVEAPSAEERQPFETMSPGEQNLFRRNRTLFLSTVARGLQALKYGFGIGSLVNDRIRYRLRSWREERWLDQLAALAPGVQDDARAAYARTVEERAQAEEAKARLTLRERSEELIAGFLRGFDKRLWSQAQLFSRANEFGFMASAGLELEAGAGSRGWGGLFDIGLSVGYNRDARTFVIQIFRDFEKYKSTSMKAVFITGALVKAGMYVANQRDGQLKREGSSFYPPMAPAYSSVTDSHFTAGFSSGLTWPPSPLGDLLTYTNTLSNKALLRISFSPALKGFVRVETGLGRDTLSGLVQPVSVAAQKIRNLFAGTANLPSCHLVMMAN